MTYWGMYGKRSNEFIEGVIAGIQAFATWKNGEQRVGVMGRLLKDEIREIKESLGWKEEEAS